MLHWMAVDVDTRRRSNPTGLCLVRILPHVNPLHWYFRIHASDSLFHLVIEMVSVDARGCVEYLGSPFVNTPRLARSEEHTSELQSHSDLVCRLLLEKKK